MEELVPLTVSGLQIVPAGTNRFTQADRGVVYGELYEPDFLAEELKEPVGVGVQMQIIDRKTKVVKLDSGLVRFDAKPVPGNPSVPYGLKLDFTNIEPGSYQVQITAGDSKGRKGFRSIDVELVEK
jgi:hypothetical protein